MNMLNIEGPILLLILLFLFRHFHLRPPDSNSIVLDLHYSLGSKVPHNLLILLIPDVPANAKIIRKSKVYEIGCDIDILTIKDKDTASYYEQGKYVFRNVKPGNYFVKMCSYYGGYKPVIKKANRDEDNKL